MSVLFTDTMTVYNHHTDPETDRERWIRTVIKGVQWTHGKRQVRVVNGVATESTAEVITIDFTRGYGNKQYVDPLTYAKLSEDAAVKCWTLDTGDSLDMIVCGAVAQEITGGYRISSLKKDYLTGVVSEISDNRNRPHLKHIKVVLQ